MTPAQLVAAADEVQTRWPTAVLAKNGVGNLAVMLDGDYVGYLDLHSGEVTALDEDD